MIYSNLRGKDDLSAYPTAIRRALEWLKRTDVLSPMAGRVDIEGNDMYAMFQDVVTKPLESSTAEVHKKYLDLFYWPQAGERIGVAQYTGQETVVEANPERDVEKLVAVRNENFLVTAPGDFMLLFPWDVHRPNLNPGEESISIRKCVVKIAMSQL